MIGKKESRREPWSCVPGPLNERAPGIMSDSHNKRPVARHGVLFMHVPKTGGVSLLNTDIASRIDRKIHSLSKDLDIAATIRDLGAADSFKFAFVRNPYDRLVSLYHYFFTMTPDHPFYAYNEHFIPRIQARRSFREFCQALPSEGYRNNFHFLPQTRYTHSRGVSVLDYMGRYEQLDRHIGDVARLLDVTFAQTPHLNRSEHDHYRNYFDARSRQIVETLYEEDLDLLAYDF